MILMIKFKGFEFYSGRRTTTGTPNSNTGYLSIAGKLVVFTNLVSLNSWIDAGEITSDMTGNCRASVNVKEARALHLGMSVADYNNMINCLEVSGI